MSEKIIKQIQDKEVVIREMNQNDLQRAQDFTAFFNALIKEGAQILYSELRTRQQINKWLKRSWAGVRKKRTIMLIGECQASIVARAEISPQIGHRQHVGVLHISVRKGFRSQGLGGEILDRVLEMASHSIEPRIELVRLSAFATNKRGLSFYQRHGFEKVAVIPKQYKVNDQLVDEVIMLKDV